MTFAIAVAACALLLIVVIGVLAVLALNGEKPHGSHARGPQSAPDTAGQDDDDPFAEPDDADPDKSADEFIAALHHDGEPEAGPPWRREPGATIAAGVIVAPWEPPVDRGTLESLRDRLLAWTPAPAVPQEPEAEPEPEPWCDAAGENTQQIFQRLVGGPWNPAAMADDIERSVYGSVTAKNGGDETGGFAGVSLPGLPGEDRDLPQPVHQAGAR